MSRFSSDFATHVGDGFFQFGEPVTYTPPDDGEAVALTGIVEREQVEEDPAGDGRRQRRVRGVKILSDADDADYGGVAAPSERATVTIDSIEYAVNSIGTVTSSVWRLGLVRIGSVEKSRPGYRQK